MNFSLFLVLLALAVVCILLNAVLPAGLLLLAAFFIAFFKVGKKTAKGVKRTGEMLGAGVRKEVSEAAGGHPSREVWETGIKTMGERTGDYALAPDTHRFKYKGVGAVGDASNRLIEFFKKLFQ